MKLDERYDNPLFIYTPRNVTKSSKINFLLACLQVRDIGCRAKKLLDFRAGQRKVRFANSKNQLELFKYLRILNDLNIVTVKINQKILILITTIDFKLCRNNIARNPNKYRYLKMISNPI